MPAPVVPAVALGAYLLLLWLAFGVRAIRQERRTGDHGFRGTTEAPGSPGWWGVLLLAVAIVCGLTGLSLAVAGVVRLEQVPGPVQLLGAVVVALGAGLVLRAQSVMGESWRVGVDPQERTELVTHGPFAQVRNPIFTGMVVAAAGFALLVPSWLLVLSCAALALGIHLQVRHVEEPYLLDAQGEPYRRYAASTGRFVPGLGRLPQP